MGPAHPDLITVLEPGRGWAIASSLPESAAVACGRASRQEKGPKDPLSASIWEGE